GHGCSEQEEHALDSLAREGEPRDNHDDRGCDPRPRERQEEGERRRIPEEATWDAGPGLVSRRRSEPEGETETDVREERERVPVVHGYSQTGDPVATRVECGNCLRQERPGEDG